MIARGADAQQITAHHAVASIGTAPRISAMMTYRLLTKKLKIKAAVVVAGLADLERGVKIRRELQPLYRRLFGASAAGYRSRSAVRWPHRFPSLCPLLLLHGASDWRVPVLDSIDLAR